MTDLNLPLILLAAFIAGASPGPATLAIAGTSMGQGRQSGLAIASGITVGSFAWSIAAALGLSAVMVTHGWLLETLRYLGAGYLMFLAFKSARSALQPQRLAAPLVPSVSQSRPRLALFFKGLALHLTNPKAVLFFGSLYAVGLPANAGPATLLVVIAAIGIQSTLVFHGYAVLFSNRRMTAAYVRAKRGFEAVFAVAFGFAGIKILTARLS